MSDVTVRKKREKRNTKEKNTSKEIGNRKETLFRGKIIIKEKMEQNALWGKFWCVGQKTRIEGLRFIL